MGGAEMQVKTLLEQLLHLDRFDIHYLAKHIDPEYVAEGYTLHKIPAHRKIAGSLITGAPSLWKSLQEIDPDVIYQRVACAYTGVAALYARKYNRRMVWHISSDRDLMALPWHLSWRAAIEQLNKSLIDFTARNADVIVVQNKNQESLLHSRFGRTDAIRVANFHALPVNTIRKPTDRITVCWIGNVKPIKRPELFVQLATDCLNLPNVRFVMIGAPAPSWSMWKELSDKIGKIDNLEYLGQQPQETVNEILEQAHVLVNTSVHEGMPNTFIQAWLRKALVISMAANPDHAFNEDRYGLCAHGDYQLLKELLSRAVNDHALRQAISERAYPYARDAFSDRNVEKLIEVIDSNYAALPQPPCMSNEGCK